VYLFTRYILVCSSCTYLFCSSVTQAVRRHLLDTSAQAQSQSAILTSPYRSECNSHILLSELACLSPIHLQVDVSKTRTSKQGTNSSPSGSSSEYPFFPGPKPPTLPVAVSTETFVSLYSHPPISFFSNRKNLPFKSEH